MIQRKDHFHSHFIRLHVEHFFRPWASPCLLLNKGMHFQSMEAELDELLDKAQSIPQKVLGQARAARRRFFGQLTLEVPEVTPTIGEK